ncbi:hypothetical protein O1611_g7537 [Lasiodiplodia mahajangana]|uniref:Uncharacterized protein n=1 Tax=Lasiodiplodia mahajangana TaxID=1108764 RepID=A0ACC2JF81_9PEZI|nr:hypothetical protein O1611_g7537 [Lasiodiplodia mahajangana]
MCKLLLHVSLRCDCMFCPLAEAFDSQENAGNYPHFGTNMPANSDEFWMDVEEPCDTVERDEHEHYVRCENIPGIFDFRNEWCGEKEAGIGDRLCDDCEKTCRPKWLEVYSKETVPKKIRGVAMKEGGGIGEEEEAGDKAETPGDEQEEIVDNQEDTVDRKGKGKAVDQSTN